MNEPERHSCWGCKYLRKNTESWEMPDIYWYECEGVGGMDNLRSFPFRNTKCKQWTARPSKVKA